MTDTAFFVESAQTARELIDDFGRVETVTFRRSNGADVAVGVPAPIVETTRTAKIAEDQLSAASEDQFGADMLASSEGLVYVLALADDGAEGLAGFELTAADRFTLNGRICRVIESKPAREPGNPPFMYAAVYRGGDS